VQWRCRATEDQLEPEELASLGPRDLSFFVASFFGDIKLLQQHVRELGRPGRISLFCYGYMHPLLLKGSLMLMYANAIVDQLLAKSIFPLWSRQHSTLLHPAQMLEEESTQKRLEREKEILSETVKYTSARVALKSAFGAGDK
jgi:hypothetical protein